MSGDEPTRHAGTRLLVWGLIRLVGAIALIGALYVYVPVTSPEGDRYLFVLILSVVVFGLVVAWQTHGVLVSPAPVIRAMEALGICLALFLGTFAVQYLAQASVNSAAFSEPLDKFTALYYTVTVFSTVGFGDITPVDTVARSVTMLQMLGNLVVLGLVVRLVIGAAQQGLARQGRTSRLSGGPHRV